MREERTDDYLLSSAPPLSRIPPADLVTLWEDLVLASHGLHGYGGSVAEIYAFRLGYRHNEHADGLNAARATDAARALHALLEWFARGRDVAIAVDGRPMGEWLREGRLDHRCKVRITARR